MLILRPIQAFYNSMRSKEQAPASQKGASQEFAKADLLLKPFPSSTQPLPTYYRRRARRKTVDPSADSAVTEGPGPTPPSQPAWSPLRNRRVRTPPLTSVICSKPRGGHLASGSSLLRD